MQRLLQPLHRLPEDQDEQRDAAEWRPGKPLLSGPGPGPQCVPHQESGMLLHPPPPSYASADCLSAAQTPSSMSGSISPHGQIVVPASALQQGNVTMTTVNPTQVVAGMSSWHTTSPSGTAVIPAAHTLTGARGSAEGSCGAQNITLLPVSPPHPPPSLPPPEGGTVYQPVTVVTPQGQVVTQALSPGTIRVQNNQVCVCVFRFLN